MLDTYEGIKVRIRMTRDVIGWSGVYEVGQEYFLCWKEALIILSRGQGSVVDSGVKDAFRKLMEFLETLEK